MVAIGQVHGAKLVKALGLPKYTKSAEVRFAVDEAVSVNCVYLPDDHKVRRTFEYLAKNFQLFPKVNWDVWCSGLEGNADGTKRLM